MILELAVVAELAARCAPAVAFETLAAIMRTESGFAPLAIGVNGPGGGPAFPKSRAAAVALATDLIEHQGRSVDLGLMQVNSANLRSLGLTIAEAFEPCRNVAAGARILREGYAAARRTEADPQRALRVALSRYNTGHPKRGFDNGYVVRVQDAAEIVVPAIRLRGEVAPPPRPAVPSPPDDDPSARPIWDVWAQATQAIGPDRVAMPRMAPAASGSAARTTHADPLRSKE